MRVFIRSGRSRGILREVSRGDIEMDEGEGGKDE
jgi:hypothetical protein